MVYRETRERFKLPANLAIRARDRVAKAYKQRRDRLLKFRKLSMDLDERLFRLIYKPDGIYASTSTLQRRVKPLLNIGDYQRKLLEEAKPTHATLVYRNRAFLLHITISKTIPEPKGNNPIGVDIGVKNLLVASNGFREKEAETAEWKREEMRKHRSASGQQSFR
jgi:transposase